MQKDPKHEELVSPEMQEVMRNLLTAIRVVKIYPSNNPIYLQSVRKTHQVLAQYLSGVPEYHVEVQKTQFTSMHMPAGKDAQMNKALAQDLFGKGIREIVFCEGTTDDELMELCRSLALSSEELALRSGISTIFWEKGMTHIKVTESGLDEVITTKTAGDWDEGTAAKILGEKSEKETVKSQRAFTDRTLVLNNLASDPAGFGASMVELAKQTRAAHESVEDRLLVLYREAGKKIQNEHAAESEVLFNGLAKSALELEPPYREGLINGKLYGEMDAETSEGWQTEFENELPSPHHEIQTGRFSNAWNVEQVTALLKRSAAKKVAPPAPAPSPIQLQATPVQSDLTLIAKELAEYTSEEMAVLKILGDSGMESDIIDAAVRTLIYLIPLVRNPLRPGSPDKELHLFSGVIHQLEDMLSYLLKKNNYDLATTIITALHTPVDPVFTSRMNDALKKTATKSVIKEMISDMRKQQKGTPAYQSAYAYLSILENKATVVLLELLADEKDKNARIFLLDLLKDFGKNQLALLGEYLADGRWYVVRNIVSILGETRSDQALTLLRKAADNDNVQIRQEVVKALSVFGGKKAAGITGRFLRDRDAALRMAAIRALADFQGIGAEEAKPLIEFLEELQLKQKDQEFVLEAIKALGRIGGRDAGEFLKQYTGIRWWRSRALQKERRAAAERAMEEISKRRQGDGGREKR